MKKNCPGKKGLSSFSDQFYENKTNPFAQANSARTCSDCLNSDRASLRKQLFLLAPCRLGRFAVRNVYDSATEIPYC